MEEILISIIVPVYNAERYLTRCVDSLLNQSLLSIEIILIDDGSGDRSGAICNEYAARDARVRVLHKENAGTMLAWMDGVRISCGKYIGFVDSDDWVAHDMYEKLYRRLEEINGDIIACGCIRRGKKKDKVFFRIEQNVVFDKAEIGERVIKDLFENVCYGNARWNKLFRRELIMNNLSLCEEKIIVGEDLYIVLACTLDAEKVVYLAEDLYYYCANEASVTSSFKENYLADSMALYLNLKKLLNKKKVDIERRLKMFYGRMVLCNVLSLVYLAMPWRKKYMMMTDYCERNKMENVFCYPFHELALKEKFALFCIKKGYYPLLLIFIELNRWRKNIKKRICFFMFKKK